MNTQRAHAYGNIPTWTFGDKVRKARDISGLHQKDFAEAIGVTASSLAAYETGRSAPRFNDAPALAKRIGMLTGIPFEWFLVEDSGSSDDPHERDSPWPRLANRARNLNSPPSDYSADVTRPIADLSEWRRAI